MLDAIANGTFGVEVAEACTGLINDLRLHDYFLVMADFDTYLEARKVADAMRVPSGWEVHWARHHEFNVYSMELKPTEKAPPPAPTKPGSKPKPPSPPTIKPTLD